jgi:hypothetical protein
VAGRATDRDSTNQEDRLEQDRREIKTLQEEGQKDNRHSTKSDCESGTLRVPDGENGKHKQEGRQDQRFVEHGEDLQNGARDMVQTMSVSSAAGQRQSRTI